MKEESTFPYVFTGYLKNEYSKLLYTIWILLWQLIVYIGQPEILFCNYFLEVGMLRHCLDPEFVIHIVKLMGEYILLTALKFKTVFFVPRTNQILYTHIVNYAVITVRESHVCMFHFRYLWLVVLYSGSFQ